MNKSQLPFRIISWVTHPILIPAIACIALYQSGHYLQYIDPQIMRAVMLVVTTFSIILPLLIVPLLYNLYVIPNLKLQTKISRIIVMTVMLAVYGLGLFLMMRYSFPTIIIQLFYAILFTSILVLISQFWGKLNFHGAAWGGLTGFILFLSIHFQLDLRMLLLITFLLSGFSGMAVLKIKQCKSYEFYLAFLLGTTSMLLIMFFLN